jgi:hypothetical protein
MAGIQDMLSSNCIAPAIVADLSKTANSAREIASGTSVKMAATYLTSLEESPGTRAIIATPASGKKIMVVR